jgi:hypothetical protein
MKSETAADRRPCTGGRSGEYAQIMQERFQKTGADGNSVCIFFLKQLKSIVFMGKMIEQKRSSDGRTTTLKQEEQL